MSTKASFWHQFWRNTGLGVLNDLEAWVRGKRHRSEQKKVVISNSRWTALGRCGVHVLPVLVSVAIIAVNLRQIFIGIDFVSPIKSETINVAFLQGMAFFGPVFSWLVSSKTDMSQQVLDDGFDLIFTIPQKEFGSFADILVQNSRSQAPGAADHC